MNLYLSAHWNCLAHSQFKNANLKSAKPEEISVSFRDRPKIKSKFGAINLVDDLPTLGQLVGGCVHEHHLMLVVAAILLLPASCDDANESGTQS